MTKLRTVLLAGGGACTLLAGVLAASAAGFFTNGVPVAGGTQYPTTLPLTGNETFPADTNLTAGQNPASEAITTNQIASWVGGQQALAGWRNALIGGDATTNLFQRGTAGASQTTTVAYGGPDRWAYWSGTATAVTLSQDSTAGDLTPGYRYAFKFARTSGQTGVVQACMAQEVETSQAIAFAGTTAEVDFNALAGANYSPTNSLFQVYIVTGTGTDEGMQKLAYGVNAGGGGASAWTGQANALAGSVAINATNGRYMAVASIPATATELGVVLCFTPTGTAGTNDYVALSAIDLVRNPAVAAYVGTVQSTALVPAVAFERRPQAIETVLQQRYTFSINEGTITAGAAMVGTGMAPTATTCLVQVPFPVTMRIAPTYSNALTATTLKLNSAAANVALSTPFSATTGANTPYNASVTFTAATLGATAGWACEPVSAAGSGQLLFSAEL